MEFEEEIRKVAFYKLSFYDFKNSLCTLDRKSSLRIFYGSFHYSLDYGLKYDTVGIGASVYALTHDELWALSWESSPWSLTTSMFLGQKAPCCCSYYLLRICFNLACSRIPGTANLPAHRLKTLKYLCFLFLPLGSITEHSGHTLGLQPPNARTRDYNPLRATDRKSSAFKILGM